MGFIINNEFIIYNLKVYIIFIKIYKNFYFLLDYISSALVDFSFRLSFFKKKHQS
jgi:hypothetical protein